MSTPWTTVGVSIKGTRDLYSECQDACKFVDTDHYSVVAVADGVGSCFYAEKGAKLSVARAVAEIESVLVNLDSDSFPNWSLVFDDVINTIRASLLETAHSLSTPPQEWQLKSVDYSDHASIHDLSCTLMIAVMYRDITSLYFIGDGIVVSNSDDSYKLLFEPYGFDNPSKTMDVTHNNYKVHEQIDIISSKEITNLAILTDWWTYRIINPDLSPEIEVFEPIFNLINQDDYSSEEKTEALASFLSTDIVNETTEDDRTLVVMRKL